MKLNGQATECQLPKKGAAGASAGDQTTTSTTSQTSLKPTPPLVLWAQRADKIFLTLQIQDCKEPEIKIEKEKLFFKGKSDSIQNNVDHAEHELTIEFYKPVNVDESKHSTRARGIEFIIIKEEASWWPRLLKDSSKQHWLKVDFPKWKDEDDSDDEQAGMPGMGGMGGMPGMDAMGAGGFGGFGGGGTPDFGDFMQQFGGGAEGMPGAGDEDSESDDDDTEQSPPDLE